jgi:hypothetical protein
MGQINERIRPPLWRDLMCRVRQSLENHVQTFQRVKFEAQLCNQTRTCSELTIFIDYYSNNTTRFSIIPRFFAKIDEKSRIFCLEYRSNSKCSCFSRHLILPFDYNENFDALFDNVDNWTPSGKVVRSSVQRQ